MAKGNNDLDRSLDDIIKRGKTRETKAGRSTTTRPATDIRRGGRGDVNKRVSTPVNRNQNSRGNRTAAVSNRRVGGGIDEKITAKAINSRLGVGISKPQRASLPKRGGSIGRIPNALPTRNKGQFMRHEQIEQNHVGRGSIDPKTLVITKTLTQIKKMRNDQSGESFVIQSSITRDNRQPRPQQARRQQPQQQHNYPPTQQLPQSSYPGYQDQHHNSLPYNNGHIDTPSYQQPPRPNNNPVPQRNIVLICNLDPRATAEDVGEACSVFGPILSCDILLDPMGRPLNEAEIEFVHSNSAEECVSKLDNGIADGRVVRVRLQSGVTLPVVPRYSSRTVISSARVVQSGFDNNLQHPIMHEIQNNGHYNNTSPYSQQHAPQQRHPQQYQRRPQ